MRVLLFCTALLVSLSSSAQSFNDVSDFYEGFYWNAFLRYTHFSDPYQETVAGLTANMSFRAVNAEKGEPNYHYENPTLGDMLYYVIHIKKVINNTTVNKSYGSGFFGWFQYYQNAMVRDRFILAPGISLGDYIFGIQQRDLATSPTTLEPNGYYFHVGPALKAAYVLNERMYLEVLSHYDIGFKATKVEGDYQHIKGYKRPHFINLAANVHHSSRIFGGVRISKINDRGTNDIKATRVDVSLGYMFRR